MNIYKRGKTYWVKFIIDGKLYQHSCKTKDKEVAKEIASAIHADTIRNRFNIPSKNKPAYIFDEVYKKYLENLSNSSKITIEIKSNYALRHFLPVFTNKELDNITSFDIKNYQLYLTFLIIA